MTELATILRSFAEQPVAPAPSIESLVERGRNHRRRRGALITGLAMVSLVAGAVAINVTGDRPGGVSINVAGPGSRSAAYTAIAPGGYEASGVWRLTIVRAGNRILYSDTTSPACGAIGAIQPGDRVYGEIHTPESVLRAGEGARCP